MADDGYCWLCGKGADEAPYLTALTDDLNVCSECEEEDRRADERIRVTPCCVCGRLARPDEPLATKTFGQETKVWSSEHVAAYHAEQRALVEEAHRKFWHPETEEDSGEAYDYLFLTVQGAGGPTGAAILTVEPEHFRPDTIIPGIPLQQAVEHLRDAGWQPGAFLMSSGRSVNRFSRQRVSPEGSLPTG